MKKRILVLAILMPLLASPIGRTGNGRVADVNDGFSTTQPKQFPQIDENADGSIRMMNPLFPQGQEGPIIIYAHRFSTFYPSRAGEDRDSLKLDFASNGWQTSVLATDHCVDVYYSTRGSARAVVAVWGVGKGVVFVSTNDGRAIAAVNEMAANLQLDPGACAWK